MKSSIPVMSAPVASSHLMRIFSSRESFKLSLLGPVEGGVCHISCHILFKLTVPDMKSSGLSDFLFSLLFFRKKQDDFK